MAHKNKKSLIRQVQERLYSWGTYKAYLQQCCQFVRYCRNQHHCKNLADCRQYVGEWMESRKDLSAYTQKLSASALRKLYGESQEELGITTKRAARSEITRSRVTAKRDSHFSEEKNAEFVEFCRSTGLRRGKYGRKCHQMLIFMILERNMQVGYISAMLDQLKRFPGKSCIFVGKIKPGLCTIRLPC